MTWHRCTLSKVLLLLNLVSFCACIGLAYHLLPALHTAEQRTAFCNAHMHHAPICALPQEAMIATMVFLGGCAFVAFVGLYATVRKNKVALGFFLAFMVIGVVVDSIGIFYVHKKLPAATPKDKQRKLFIGLALYTLSHAALVGAASYLMAKWKKEAMTLASAPHAKEGDVKMEKAGLLASTAQIV